MNISFHLLKKFIPFSHSPYEIAEILTQTGLEVENIKKVEKVVGSLNGIIVGEITHCQPHANAEKLKVTKVNIGSETLAIICGAPNVCIGQKVLVAPANTTIHPINNAPIKIKKTKIRGEISEGMICAEDEVGLGNNHKGIVVLDTDMTNGTPANKLFDLETDYVFEIGLTPNRGDAASHLGVARDLKGVLKKNILFEFPTISKQITSNNPIEVIVENTQGCPRYSGITIRNVTIAPSPEWLKWQLKAIGIEPINNVVDITNYVSHSIGQPMHAFDAEKIKDRKIKVKNLSSGTKFVSLDNKERTLSQEDLMICDGESNGLCIAGVFGGIDSGVSQSTKDIFLESAYFAADHIRKTAQRHALSTDASFRYERGTDPEITIQSLQYATSLILEITGGYIASRIIDIYPNPIKNCKIPASFDYFHKLIGEKLPPALIIETLKWLDIKISDQTTQGFVAHVPPYRSEVTRPADLVEEVLRIYGFNNIALDKNLSSGYLAESNETENHHHIKTNITNFLVGKGFYEILTNSLVNKKYYQKFPIGNTPIDIINPSSEELSVLKNHPLYTFLETITYNINRKNTNLKFFELSKSYEKINENYVEKEWLSFLMCGYISEPNWINDPKKVIFHNLNNVMRSALDFLKIEKTENIPLENHPYYEYGLRLSVHKNEIGTLGKLKKPLLKLYGIKQDVFYGQLSWENLLKWYQSDISYESINKYPEVKRDLSLVLNKNISYEKIKEITFSLNDGKNFLNRINLFSIYEEEKVLKGKKAYAISFYLQDKHKTLTDKKIDKVMDSLIRKYEKDLNAIIRK